MNENDGGGGSTGSGTQTGNASGDNGREGQGSNASQGQQSGNGGQGTGGGQGGNGNRSGNSDDNSSGGNRSGSGNSGDGSGNQGRDASSGDTDFVKTLKAENAQRRHENKQLTDTLSAATRERDELRDKATRYEAKVREYEARDAISGTLNQMRVQPQNAKTIARLVDLSTLKFDANGKADEASVKAALDSVKAEHPHLFGASAAAARDAGAGNGSGGNAGTGQKMNEFIRRAAGR